MTRLGKAHRTGETHAFREATPPSPPSLTRLIVGFVAGFASVLIFPSGVIAILHAADLIPFGPWSMRPTPPFGLPQIFSDAFWGGLWGVIYALLEPRLAARLGAWWSGGLAFGVVLPLLVRWLVVLPLKGMPAAAGLVPSAMLLEIVLHAAFGLGIAIIFRCGLRLAERAVPLSPATGG